MAAGIRFDMVDGEFTHEGDRCTLERLSLVRASAISMFDIEGEELLRALEELAQINRQPDGSCCRIALTEADRLGRDLLVKWMRELDLEIDVDQIGNIFGTYRGQSNVKPVMVGSHIDTVSTGGKFDGPYGVIAGLEVIRA